MRTTTMPDLIQAIWHDFKPWVVIFLAAIIAGQGFSLGVWSVFGRPWTRD